MKFLEYEHLPVYGHSYFPFATNPSVKRLPEVVEATMHETNLIFVYRLVILEKFWNNNFLSL